MPPGNTELDPAFERTNGVVQAIEKDLGPEKGAAQVDENVRAEIFTSLDGLRKADQNFATDLTFINARLQHDGFLPNLYIVGNDIPADGDAGKQIGPNGKDGFHLSDLATAPTPGGGNIDFSPPQHASAPDGENQTAWHGSNPGNPVGSTGGDGNVGGSTPIGDSAVQSNPVGLGALGTPELTAQIQQALQLLNAQRAAEGLPPIDGSPENMKAILEIIQHESGGNPNAQNNTDSNAAKGDPSRGLMQTIGSTFGSYHVHGTSDNIFDPVANIAAGVNYAVSRYGSLESVPGVKATASGGSYVGY